MPFPLALSAWDPQWLQMLRELIRRGEAEFPFRDKGKAVNFRLQFYSFRKALIRAKHPLADMSQTFVAKDPYQRGDGRWVVLIAPMQLSPAIAEAFEAVGIEEPPEIPGEAEDIAAADREAARAAANSRPAPELDDSPPPVESPSRGLDNYLEED